MFFKIQLILAIVALAAVSFFVWDYTTSKSENRRLALELRQANTSIEVLIQKVDAEREISKTENRLKRRIYNAPKSDDGPVAPVLRDTINGLSDGGAGRP